MDMRITAKNKFRTLVILLLILAVTVSTALWSVLRTRDGTREAYADTSAAAIVGAINNAEPWGSVSSVTVGNGAGDNGVVVTVVESDVADEDEIVLKEIVLKTGAQAVVNETLPSAQHELEGSEKYSLVVFDVPVTVQSEAKLTLNADVVFRAGVTVYGTLEINGMAFNQGAMTVSNTLNNYSEIKSEGVIVNGSLNNDGERNGTIAVSDGSALTVNAGGALFLKADKNNALGVSGTITNKGSVIYQRATTVNFSLGENSKAAIPATFISSLSLSGDDDGRYVFYPEKPDTGEGTALPADDGTALTLLNGNSGTTGWSGVTLLSFGRTTLKNSEDNAYYTFTNVNLGGSASGDFTQGANELIFDGGAAWTQGDSSDGYDLHFLVGSDSSTRTEYRNGGRYSASALVRVSGTLNMHGGVKITHHETRAGNGVGGGVNVPSGATLNMHGGEISYNAVTQCKNNGAGAGVYGYFAEINIAGGKITRNANATYSDGSADGAGLALDASSLTMSGGEISWNCGAVGGTDAGADGGGIIARSEDDNPADAENASTLTASSVTLSGGSISNNWTGGFGGGILLWQSHLTMTGGEIAENGASFGGGIGMTSGKRHTGDDSTSKAGYARISGGTISGNYAFYNKWNTQKPQGGYGGGICVGSNINEGDNYKLYSFVEFSGEAIVADNRAIYGGGLAVYTTKSADSNTITMSGGTITGNTAENGNGVYVFSTSDGINPNGIEKPMLTVSGAASIDTSNDISFNYDREASKKATYNVRVVDATQLGNRESGAIAEKVNTPVWNKRDNIYNVYFINNHTNSANEFYTYYDNFINKRISDEFLLEFQKKAKEYTSVYYNWGGRFGLQNGDNADDVDPVASWTVYIAPIEVSDELSGSALAALVYLGDDAATAGWTNSDVVVFSESAHVNRNKFLLDSATYTFTETSNALQIAAVAQDATDSVAYNANKTPPYYSSLADAVAAAEPGDTIQILRSATLDKTIVIDKNITIVPNGDFTLYIKSGFDTSGAINPALFRVENGATLTLGGQNTLTVSGNTSEENIPLVTVINGSYVQKSGVTLTGASVNDDAEIHNVQTDASAIYLASSNASATIEGGVIRSNKGGLGAIYVGDGASLTLSGGAIGGTLDTDYNIDTDHNVDKNGLEYGVYVTGRGKVSLNGSVALYDAINLSAKGASVTVGAGYANALTENDTIRLTYADSFDADDVVVNILNTYAGDADTVFSDFALYEMDESLYALRLRGSSDGDSIDALVVQKAVRYIFDFRYQNGYSDDTLVSGMGYSGGSMKNAIESLIQSLNGTVFANEGRIMSRGETLVVYVFSGSESFSLGNLKTFAQKTGWTLSTWHRGSADSVLSAIGDSASLAYTNSSAPITLRSVWTPNQFNITFDSNYTGLGDGAQPSLIEGTMESQIVDYSDLETSNQEARLTVNNYTAVGFLFTGWSLTGGKDAEKTFENGKKLSADDWDTMINGVIGVEHEATETKAGYVEYSITLYAVWENLFSGGVGTSANPFKIGKIEDLYILEATTMGKTESSDSNESVSEAYYNTHTDGGAKVAYAAENYEGYFFLLTADLTGFKGVIGRTSSKNAQAKDQDEEITASLPKTVSDGNADGLTLNGTPFAGTFDGNGKSIGLAINKQQVTETQYEEAKKAAEAAGGTLAWVNGDETLLGAGLFGYTVGATISNLTLTGSVHGYSHVGGLVGYAVNTAISSIYNEAAVSSGGHDVGGIVGTYFVTDESETQYVITNVVNEGAISYAPRLDDKTTKLSEQTGWSETKKLSDVQGIRFGGIVGYGITMRLTGGYNTGDVTGRYAVGGVVGILHSLNNNTTSDTTLTNSFNTGAVTATAGLYATVHSEGVLTAEAVNAYVGGLVGRAVGASAIDTAFNSGRVTASWTGVKNTSGGYDYADLSAPEPSADSEYIGARGAGGIVGFTSYNKSANEGDLKSIANVYNTGAISAWASVGGIAGYFAYSTVSRAYNGGSVLAKGFHFEDREQVWGGMQTSDGSYHAFLGSLVGMSIGSSLSDVYYNTDKRYEHFTDETLRQIGDYEYTAETLGFAESTFSSDRGRTASQMSVIAANNRPSGFGTDFSGTYWSFLYYADQTTGEAGQAEEGQPVEGQTYHYPQLNAFAGDGNTVTIGGRSFELGEHSKNSTLVTVPANGGENDKPITDTDSVTISYSLGGGAFTFAGGSDDDGYYFAEGGYRYNLVDGFWQTKVVYKIGGGAAHDELAQLEQPDDPARVGYRFTGWYSDAACREPFSFGSIPASDKTVYAGWEAVTYTFVYEEFSSRGASFVGEHDATFSILNAGSREQLPTANDVTRRGYTLSGWLYNNKAVDSYRVIAPSSGTPYIEFYSGGSDVETVLFNTIVNQQLYLTAVWEAEPYTITYNGLTADKFVDRENATLNGAKENYTITDSFTFAKPQKKGYTFDGWKLVSLDGKTATGDLDSINKEHYAIGSTISGIVSGTVGDIVLEAQWTRNNVTLYLDARGGEIVDFDTEHGLGQDESGRYFISVPYYSNGNDALAFLFGADGFAVEATLPEGSGRTFNGWYTVVNPSENDKPIAKDFTVTGDASGTGSQTIYAGYETSTWEIAISLGDHADSVNADMEDELKAAGFAWEGALAAAQAFTLKNVLHGSSASEALELLVSAINEENSWNFLGWDVTESNGSASIYNVTSNLTITAQYSQTQVAVNFVGLNGELLGSVTIGQSTAIGEENAAYTDIEAKAESYFGYDFKGWYYTDASGVRQNFALTDPVSASMVVYADLQAKKIAPQFVLTIDGAQQEVPLDGYTYDFGATFGQFPTLSDLLDQLSDEVAKKYLGYQISRWSVNGSPVNTNTVITQEMVNSGTWTIELHAELTKATYSISFNANGGSFQGVTPVGTYQFGNADSVQYHAGSGKWKDGLPVPQRAGHTPAWNVYDANGSRLGDTSITDAAGLIALLDAEGYAGDLSLIAAWTAEVYTVWFYADGGTFTVPEEKIKGITFYAKDQTTEVTAENQSQYPAVYFTMEVQYGTVPNPPVALDAPQRNGFIFLGWRSDSNGAPLTDVTSAGQYSQKSPIVAYWTEGKYSITFVTNGGTPISDITGISYGADLSEQLKGITIERVGYTFAGWYTDSKCEQPVGDTMPSKDLVLYAKWEVNSYTLTLNIAINGGTVDAQTIADALKLNVTAVRVESAEGGYTVKITVPYETNLSALNTIAFGGYFLSGTWTHKTDGKVFLTFMPADNYEVSGTFTTPEKPSESVTVTFYLTDGTVVYYKTTVSSGTVIKEEDLPNPIRTGYTFIEWRTAEGEKFEFTTQIDEDTTLYAHWKANEYMVTLRGEGVNLDPNPIEVAFGTELLWGTENAPLPVPARGGYTFEGWYLDADFSTTAEGTAMPAYDITLYAKWKATEYSIVFEWGLESEKTTVTIDGAYNSALDFSSVGGAVPHYTFIWQVTADGKDPIPVTLDDFRTMPNLSEKFAGYTSVVEGRVSITVQAAYTPIGYTITLDGADPVPVTVKDASSEKTEFAKLGGKTGYTFAGWKLSSSDTAYNYYAVGENGGEWGVYLYSDEVSADGYFVRFTEGFSLYLTAAYTAMHVSVTLDSQGGSGAEGDFGGDYDSVLTELPVPTKPGYTFDGWYVGDKKWEDDVLTTENGVEEQNGVFTLALTAHWTAIKYNIIYNLNGGSGNPNPTTYTIEQTVQLNKPTDAPTGYTFLYWMNAATGKRVDEITAGSMGDITLIAQYKPNTYGVSVSGSGISADVQSVLHGQENVVIRLSVTEVGYHLPDSVTTVTMSGTQSVEFTYDNGVLTIQSPVTGEITITASAQQNTYTVTFDANGGEGTMDDMPFTYGTAQKLSPNTFKRTGYTFKGWARSNSAEVMYADEAEVSNLTSRNGATVTLYAVWEANTYTVTFDKNVGDGETTTQGFTYGVAQNLSANAFTRTGYTFAGWATDPKGTEVKYADGASVINLTATDKDNVTLYAVWRADSYTIVFVGGEFAMGAMNNQTVLYNGSITLTKNRFVRLGYTFLGWAYSDGAEVSIKNEGSIKIDENFEGVIEGTTITLHAVWSPIEYTLKLEANGGDFVDEISSSVTGTYGGYFVLPDAEKLVREGYTFLGWSTSASGESVLYNGGASVPVQLFTDGLKAAGIVGTLHAVWTENVYEVTFDGEHVRSNGAASAVYGNTYSAKLTVDTGYTLTQGEISVEMDGTEFVQFTYADGVLTISSPVTGDIVITAKAAANTYTIAYKGDGVNIASTSGTFGSAITLADPTRQGFTFLGWYINGDEETLYRGSVSVGMLAFAAGVENQNGETITITITLNAKWQAAEGALTVTIVHADGSQQTIGVTSGEPLPKAKINVPKGYDYDKATYHTDSADGEVFDFKSIITNDMTLYVAGGEHITYNITLNYGDGEKTVALTVKYGQPLDSAEGWEETPVRIGYEFGGWYNGDVRMTGGSIVTGALTLTAQWNAIEYTVTFNPNGGSGEQTTQTHHYGDAVEPISDPPVRNGYTFEGWYYNGKKWVSGTAMPAENITLVAMWTLQSFTVSFSVGDGATGVADQTIYFGFKATKPTDPVRSGYSFGGWMLDGSEYDFGTPVRDNITLTAKWLPRTYSIEYVLGGGVNASSNPASYNIESGTIVLADPTREGFIFLGWYDAEQNGNRVTEIKAGSTGRITLYARWQANTYIVDFVLNGGTMKNTEQIVVAGGTVAFEEPTRENYLFMGWFTDAACTQRYDFSTPVTGDLTLYAKWRLSVISGTASDGTIVTITSDDGFDDGTTIRFTEVTDETTLSEAAGSLAENMTLARLFDIELIAADGTPVSIDKPLSVGISVQGLADAVGRYAVVYVPDGGGTIEEIATHIGEDGRMYFFVEHFSFYAVVDVLDIAPTGGFAWWWILVAVAGCAALAGIIVLLARSMRRYELNYVNGGVPAQKLKESALVDLPLPEREEEVFDGWYYDEMFRDRATLTSMPKQNLILFAKWRKMTEEERAARDRARAEAAAAAAEGFHEAKPKKEKKHKENPLNEIKEDE